MLVGGGCIIQTYTDDLYGAFGQRMKPIRRTTL